MKKKTSKVKKSLLPTYLSLLLLLVILLVVTFFYINSHTHLKTFTDESLKSFSFQHDPTKWTITSVADVADCGGMGCSPVYGRSIQLESIPNHAKLKIGLVQNYNPITNMEGKQNWCFEAGSLEPISLDSLDDTWFRGVMPDERSYYYPKNAIKTVNGKYCVYPSLNKYEQSPLPITYNGKPVVYDIELNSSNSEDIKLADKIVNSIKVVSSNSSTAQTTKSKTLIETITYNKYDNATSAWKVYTSPDNIYSFKYPANLVYAYTDVDRNGQLSNFSPHFFNTQSDADNALKCILNKQGIFKNACHSRGLFDVTDVTNFHKSAKQSLQDYLNTKDPTLLKELYIYSDSQGRRWIVRKPVYGLGGT